RARVHFHAGTAETVGEIYLYKGTFILPGSSALAHFKLQDEIVLGRRDGFIVPSFRRWYPSVVARSSIRWRGVPREKTLAASLIWKHWKKARARKFWLRSPSATFLASPCVRLSPGRNGWRAKCAPQTKS